MVVLYFLSRVVYVLYYMVQSGALGLTQSAIVGLGEDLKKMMNMMNCLFVKWGLFVCVPKFVYYLMLVYFFKEMYSYGPPHMAVQKQDDQLELTYSNYVRTQAVTLKTCRRRWVIGRSGERGSGISVLTARHDDDDDDISLCAFAGAYLCTYICFSTGMDIYIFTPIYAVCWWEGVGRRKRVREGKSGCRRKKWIVAIRISFSF